jgi:catechol 2,3-dioxygenase-like lactoylglutathione lyase family enzyme
MIIGIAHVNLTVPPGTLEQAAEFYGNTLGFTRVAVPVLQKDTLAWYALFPFLPVSFTPSCPRLKPPLFTSNPFLATLPLISNPSTFIQEWKRYPTD